MLGVILISCVVLFLSWWYISYYQTQKHLSVFPGPPVIPLIGNVYSIKLGQEWIPSLMKLHKKYGDIVQINAGLAPKLIFAGIKPVQFLLSSKVILNKAEEAIYFSRWLGDGLLFSPAETWKIRRKILTPAFHYNILQNYTVILNKESNLLIKKLEAIKTDFDVVPILKLYALDIVFETLMNTSMNSQKNTNAEYVDNVDKIIAIAYARSYSILKRYECFYKLSSDYQNEKRHLKVLHEFADSVIKKRQRELENGADQNGKEMNLLDILLTSTVNGDPLSNEEIRYEVHNFLLAGYDTLTAALSFTCYLLAKHPDIQEKVNEELQNLFGQATTVDKSYTYQDIQSMKYLEQVIKESLRMYSPGAVITRTLQEDTVYDGHILPKHLSITVFIHALHYNEKLYPNPEVFDPDRFNEINSKDRSPYAYLPFSFGIRNCIGKKYAMLEMKCTIAKILRNFKILPGDNHKPIVNRFGIIKSDNGIFIRLEKKNVNSFGLNSL